MAFKSKKIVSFKGTGSDGSSPAHISKKQASAPSTDSQIVTREMLYEALQAMQEKIVTLLNEKTNEGMRIIEEILTGKQQMKEDIIMEFGSLEDDIELGEIKQFMEVIDGEVREIQNGVGGAGVDEVMIQGRRVVKEQRQQDLKEITPGALVQWLRKMEGVMGWPNDKVYETLQATIKNKNKFQVKGQDVMTMKEIPPKMLRVRSDINFIIS